MPSSYFVTSSAALLLQACTGQQITIPRLSSLFPAWKARFNRNHEESVDHHLHDYQTRQAQRP
jgi:hypothetical protein